MEKQQIHIGHMIKTVFDESGMSVAEFARQIHCTRPNVYAVFERHDIGVEQLLKISIALKHNFLLDILEQCGLEMPARQIHLNLVLDKLNEVEIKNLLEIIEKSK